MRRFPNGVPFPRFTTLFALASLWLAGGCGNGPAPPGRFESSGELIAVSGGEAGARGACITCHGLEGQGDGALVPRIAGLSSGYILRQLEFYDAGQRRHPQMHWIAGRLDNKARVKVAKYYAALPWPPERASGSAEPGATASPECAPAVAALYHAGDASRGLQACADCHGPAGGGIGAGNPPLAGQSAAYVEAQLRAWRSGERYGDPQGAMASISRRLRESELRPLSDYIGRLTGDPARPEPREACPPARRPGPRNDA